ncbi:MAG: hypothetical protein M3N68_00105, partial [Actinomycetota bacterium]|nr:hypothetical protein [Actinomycetota bacterium]
MAALAWRAPPGSAAHAEAGTTREGNAQLAVVKRALILFEAAKSTALDVPFGGAHISRSISRAGRCRQPDRTA